MERRWNGPSTGVGREGASGSGALRISLIPFAKIRNFSDMAGVFLAAWGRLRTDAVGRVRLRGGWGVVLVPDFSIFLAVGCVFWGIVPFGLDLVQPCACAFCSVGWLVWGWVMAAASVVAGGLRFSGLAVVPRCVFLRPRRGCLSCIPFQSSLI